MNPRTRHGKKCNIHNSLPVNPLTPKMVPPLNITPTLNEMDLILQSFFYILQKFYNGQNVIEPLPALTQKQQPGCGWYTLSVNETFFLQSSCF